MEKRLKREDLYIGRRVTYDELRDIHDIYIILGNVTGYTPRLSGDIAYVAEDRDEYSTKLLLSGAYRCIFNDSLDEDEDISYDG